MYDPVLVEPMRKELTELGVEELKTAGEVDALLQEHKGTALVVVNSVCGCAAAHARPGVAMALQNKKLPDRVTTVFAGMDLRPRARQGITSRGFFPRLPDRADEGRRGGVHAGAP